MDVKVTALEFMEILRDVDVSKYDLTGNFDLFQSAMTKKFEATVKAEDERIKTELEKLMGTGFYFGYHHDPKTADYVVSMIKGDSSDMGYFSIAGNELKEEDYQVIQAEVNWKDKVLRLRDRLQYYANPSCVSVMFAIRALLEGTGVTPKKYVKSCLGLSLDDVAIVMQIQDKKDMFLKFYVVLSICVALDTPPEIAYRIFYDAEFQLFDSTDQSIAFLRVLDQTYGKSLAEKNKHLRRWGNGIKKVVRSNPDRYMNAEARDALAEEWTARCLDYCKVCAV